MHFLINACCCSTRERTAAIAVIGARAILFWHDGTPEENFKTLACCAAGASRSYRGADSSCHSPRVCASRAGGVSDLWSAAVHFNVHPEVGQPWPRQIWHPQVGPVIHKSWLGRVLVCMWWDPCLDLALRNFEAKKGHLSKGEAILLPCA